MNHPEITNLNASLYYAKRLKEAEDYRRARKFASQKTLGAFLSDLRKHLPAWSGKSVGKSIQSQA